MIRGDRFLSLVPHDGSPGAAVDSIVVRAHVAGDGALALTYRLAGRLGQVRLPEPLPPSATAAPTHELWRHTCFEAFVARGDEQAYREFNFSPSGEWAAYAFRAYRERDATAPPIPAPIVNIRREKTVLELSAVLAAEALPSGARGNLRLGLSMVVEEACGSLSFWALRHPGTRPDFHHRDGFALELWAPPGARPSREPAE